MEVDDEAELNKKCCLKEYLVKLTKEALAPELMLNMVNLSRSDPYLAYVGLTNFVNEVLPESITTDDLL